MQGCRRPDTLYSEIPHPWPQPGDYWRYVDENGEPKVSHGSMEASIAVGNLTGGIWGFCAPNGAIGTMSLHTVREHEDGTISVRPGDGSSNSILVTGSSGPEWHGYIDHGIWEEC